MNYVYIEHGIAVNISACRSAIVVQVQVKNWEKKYLHEIHEMEAY